MHHMTAAWSRSSAVSGGLGMPPDDIAAYSPSPAIVDRSLVRRVPALTSAHSWRERPLPSNASAGAIRSQGSWWAIAQQFAEARSLGDLSADRAPVRFHARAGPRAIGCQGPL